MGGGVWWSRSILARQDFNRVECMNRSDSVAAKLPEWQRKALAVQALAKAESITELAAGHGVSRKFAYAQTQRAGAALDEAFATAANDEEKVLFELTITPRVVDKMIVALVLMCRGSYRGVIEFMRDVVGWSVSLGSVHNVLEAAALQASVVNAGVDLSAVRVGLHDEIFQGPRPCSPESMRSRPIATPGRWDAPRR